MKEEKKLNDEDLVKALENCQKDNCDNCPYFINDKACMANNLLADILDLIRRLQYGYSSASKASEEWKVKYEQEREENVARKSEIERLTEENAILKENPPILAGRSLGKTIRAKLLAFDKMKEQNAKLQKQVDELKGQKETLYIEMSGGQIVKMQLGSWAEMSEIIKQQAVKDTAKEILQPIMSIIKKSNGFLAEEVVRIMAKQRGVEVEK